MFWKNMIQIVYWKKKYPVWTMKWWEKLIKPQKYENIYNILQKNSKTSIEQEPEYSENQDYTLIDLLPIAKKDEDSMKNELKTFLKKQLHNGTDISAWETTSISNSFSLY